MLNKLPSKARSLWETVYNRALEQSYEKQKAAKIAWIAVKRKYLVGGDLWVSRGGQIVDVKQAILRNFEKDGDIFIDAYVTSFEPDDGDIKNSGAQTYSTMVSKSVAPKIAAELETLRIGGGIEHDTFPSESTYDSEADDVWHVVKATVDDKGIRALLKLNNKSKRFQEVAEGIERKKYRGVSLEIIPGNNAFNLKEIDGRTVKELKNFRRIAGVSLTRFPLDKYSTINASYKSKKK